MSKVCKHVLVTFHNLFLMFLAPFRESHLTLWTPWAAAGASRILRKALNPLDPLGAPQALRAY